MIIDIFFSVSIQILEGPDPQQSHRQQKAKKG